MTVVENNVYSLLLLNVNVLRSLKHKNAKQGMHLLSQGFFTFHYEKIFMLIIYWMGKSIGTLKTHDALGNYYTALIFLF